jgi:periplasmic protein CpxP/Spy
MTERLIRFAAVTALAAGMALAQRPAPRPKAGQGRAQGGMVQRRIMQNLNLTDSQKQQARAIFEQTRETLKPVRAQLQKNAEAMRAARQTNDAAQIRSLAAQQGTLRGDVLAAQSDSQARFRSILTPEQQAKLDQMRERAGKQRQRVQQRLQQRLQQRRNG